MVLGLFSYLMGPRAGFFTMLGLQMIPGAALDALFAVPVFVLLVKLKVVPVPRAEVGADRRGGAVMLEPVTRIGRSSQEDSFIGFRVGVLLISGHGAFRHHRLPPVVSADTLG